MPKAINWPADYRDAILTENTDDLYAALRLGTLYYNGQYWTPDEPVDIRCNHLKVRRGVVRGELAKTTIGSIDDSIVSRLKPDLQSIDAIKAFFNKYYGQTVTDDTELTVVFYQNLAVDPEYMDTPDPSGRFI